MEEIFTCIGLLNILGNINGILLRDFDKHVILYMKRTERHLINLASYIRCYYDLIPHVEKAMLQSSTKH